MNFARLSRVNIKWDFYLWFLPTVLSIWGTILGSFLVDFEAILGQFESLKAKYSNVDFWRENSNIFIFLHESFLLFLPTVLSILGIILVSFLVHFEPIWDIKKAKKPKLKYFQFYKNETFLGYFHPLCCTTSPWMVIEM